VIRVTPLGDRALTIVLGDSIDETTHHRVRAVSKRIEMDMPTGIVDLVPAFASVTVHYDPVRVSADTASETRSPFDRLVAQLDRLLSDVRENELPTPRLVEIPVCYGGSLGPDLDEVARKHDLQPDDVIQIHSSGEYLVYMVGFMPGFAYLGGLSPRIATPRRASPRTAVPARSVGIGGQQTGVYPLESPGGWNLIGRTPLEIFDLRRPEPMLLATGDRVRFRPISLDEFRTFSFTP
jgi:inhibitor of KinA